MDIDYTELPEDDRREIRRLLSACPNDPPHLEDIWHVMDSVWDDLGCSNRNPSQDCLRHFYSHPVWVLNGLFVQQHALSMQHRNAVAEWVFDQEISHVLDYGGGFGTLARLIAEDSTVTVAIYEPYPSEVVLRRTKRYPNIQFTDCLDEPEYECIIAMDVLEHVVDPLGVLATMIDVTKTGGFLIIANHFRPSTKCHLPGTFHLRYTFDLFATTMGLRVLGPCPDSHAKIYKKRDTSGWNWRGLRTMEAISRAAFPVLDAIHPMHAWMRRLLG